MKTVVSMNAQGRLTVPAVAREVLRLDGPTEFELEVTAHELILRPALVIPREDAWAYTAEHLSRVELAREDARDGRTRALTEKELEDLAEPTA